MDKIVILTGAGISTESGLGTFRDNDGLWAQHRIEDVATPEGFARNPTLVHEFYNARRVQAAEARPNAAHAALARLQREYAGEVVIITQNVDGLHEAAGAAPLHMHGRLTGALCGACDHRWKAALRMSPKDHCPACGAACTRPDVVWFGEEPYLMQDIWAHLGAARIFVSIGTSGQVYPAAAFAQHSARAGAHCVDLNLEPPENIGDFTETRHGAATDIVPVWVEELLRC